MLQPMSHFIASLYFTKTNVYTFTSIHLQDLQNLRYLMSR